MSAEDLAYCLAHLNIWYLLNEWMNAMSSSTLAFSKLQTIRNFKRTSLQHHSVDLEQRPGVYDSWSPDLNFLESLYLSLNSNFDASLNLTCFQMHSGLPISKMASLDLASTLVAWEGLRAGGEGDNRGWDGGMASATRWTWVWVNSGSWWWTGRPGVLRFMGSQSRTRLSNWTESLSKQSEERKGSSRSAQPRWEMYTTFDTVTPSSTASLPATALLIMNPNSGKTLFLSSTLHILFPLGQR